VPLEQTGARVSRVGLCTMNARSDEECSALQTTLACHENKLMEPASARSPVVAEMDSAALFTERPNIPFGRARTTEDFGTYHRPCRLDGPVEPIATARDTRDADLVTAAARGRNILSDFFTRYRNDRLIRTNKKPVLLLNAELKEVYRRILIPFDFSEKARAAAHAALLAFPDAQVVFLHAFQIPNEDMLRDAEPACEIFCFHRSRVRDAARTALLRFTEESGYNDRLISHVVHYGCPMPVVCNYAKKMEADLIAIGWHEEPWFRGLVPGFTARHLMNETLSDVLVAPAPATASPVVIS
jgi:nucleotide-binding universal stress UspA family protein